MARSPGSAGVGGFREVSADWLLSELFGDTSGRSEDVCRLSSSEELAATPWRVAWNDVAPQERRSFLERSVPALVGFSTSGHTGPPKQWVRTRSQLMAEIDLWTGVLRAGALDGVVVFAPPYHLYGFLGALLFPAVHGLPVWFRPMSFPSPVAMDELARPLFVAVPSALTLLRNQADGLAGYESVTVVHSTAVLPSAGRELMRKLGDRVRLVELFGSTETGLVATRTNGVDDSVPWELSADVELASTAQGAGEVQLRVRSPRLAFEEGGEQLPDHQLDDLVRFTGPRSFVFEGRESLLVKVNGRRVYLDRIEDAVRGAIHCRDLACVPALDDLRGEGFDLLVVPDPERPVTERETRRSCLTILKDIGQPRRVTLVEQIPRTGTGKLRLEELRRSDLRP